MKKLLVMIIIFCSSVVYALPGIKKYKATWIPNIEEDLASYSLYWRTPGDNFNDANKISGIVTNSQMLTEVVPYNSEIAVTAVDTSGNESEFSNIIPFSQDGTAPAAPSLLKIETVE